MKLRRQESFKSGTKTALKDAQRQPDKLAERQTGNRSYRAEAAWAEQLHIDSCLDNQSTSSSGTASNMEITEQEVSSTFRAAAVKDDELMAM